MHSSVVLAYADSPLANWHSVESRHVFAYIPLGARNALIVLWLGDMSMACVDFPMMASCMLIFLF